MTTKCHSLTTLQLSVVILSFYKYSGSIEFHNFTSDFYNLSASYFYICRTMNRTFSISGSIYPYPKYIMLSYSNWIWIPLCGCCSLLIILDEEWKDCSVELIQTTIINELTLILRVQTNICIPLEVYFLVMTSLRGYFPTTPSFKSARVSGHAI